MRVPLPVILTGAIVLGLQMPPLHNVEVDLVTAFFFLAFVALDLVAGALLPAATRRLSRMAELPDVPRPLASQAMRRISGKDDIVGLRVGARKVTGFFQARFFPASLWNFREK